MTNWTRYWCLIAGFVKLPCKRNYSETHRWFSSIRPIPPFRYLRYKTTAFRPFLCKLPSFFLLVSNSRSWHLVRRSKSLHAGMVYRSQCNSLLPNSPTEYQRKEPVSLLFPSIDPTLKQHEFSKISFCNTRSIKILLVNNNSFLALTLSNQWKYEDICILRNQIYQNLHKIFLI